MHLLVISFIAGILTVLAPCVLPLLPVIVGGSVIGSGSRNRPYIIVASLAASLFIFTLALKATTALLNIPAAVWTITSGGLLIVLGILTVWPGLYELISIKTGFLNSSQQALADINRRRGISRAILIGAALGPVFASCSPTFALIIATILPASFGLGLLYLVVYILGLSLFLLAIALLGHRLTTRLGWAINPNGWFKRSLGVLFILVGLAVVTGFDKTIENWLIDHQIFDSTKLEQQLLPGVPASTSGTNKEGANFALSTPIAAPELTGLTNWINSDPQTLAGLKGKVVLIDFWTYSCINCIHTLPHVEGWYEKYQSDGLVVLGIHAPEFAFEHVPANVQQAVKDDHITYPVALDNDLATWRAFSNQYWPAEYFIDRQGRLRHYQFGEGEYDNDEKVIRALLAEDGTSVGGAVSSSAAAIPNPDQSPETYLGYERAEHYSNDIHQDALFAYNLPNTLGQNYWALGGNWTVGAQDTVAGASAVLRYRFSAKQVYLVMGSDKPTSVKVLVNGRPVSETGLAGADVGPDGTVQVSGARLYRLVKSDQMLNGATLELQLSPGVTVRAFTFDS